MFHMSRSKLAAVGLSWLLLTIPAFAGWSAPTIIQNNNAVAAHSCSNVGSVAQGSFMIEVGGAITNATADAMVVTDNAGTGNVWSTAYTSYRTTTINAVFVSWAYNTGAFSGKTVSVSDTSTGATNFIRAACSLIAVTGGNSEDTAVRGANAGTATTTPTVTSGTPTKAGDLFIVSYHSPNNVTNAYTEDAAWTNLVNRNGDSNEQNSIAYLINSGTGTKTHAPTTASQTYVQEIIGFKLPNTSSLLTLGVH
jgi:hypothetical protein